MSDMMDFPKTPLEFVESYKFKDSDEIYTNGSELIQVFRVEQMLEHYYKPLREKATPKNVTNLGTFFDKLFLVGKCPCCETKVNDSGNYCHHCGQRISFEEE